MSWHPHGVLGPLWGVWSVLRPQWCVLWGILASLGSVWGVLGSMWGVLGPPWGLEAPMVCSLGSPGAPVGSWSPCGVSWGPHGVHGVPRGCQPTAPWPRREVHRLHTAPRRHLAEAAAGEGGIRAPGGGAGVSGAGGQGEGGVPWGGSPSGAGVCRAARGERSCWSVLSRSPGTPDLGPATPGAARAGSHLEVSVSFQVPEQYRPPHPYPISCSLPVRIDSRPSPPQGGRAGLGRPADARRTPSGGICRGAELGRGDPFQGRLLGRRVVEGLEPTGTPWPGGRAGHGGCSASEVLLEVPNVPGVWQWGLLAPCRGLFGAAPGSSTPSRGGTAGERRLHRLSFCAGTRINM